MQNFVLSEVSKGSFQIYYEKNGKPLIGKRGIIKKFITLTVCVAMTLQIVSVAADDKKPSEKTYPTSPKYTTTKLIVKYKEDANKSGILWNVRFKTGNLFLNTKKHLKNNQNIDVIEINRADRMDEAIEAFVKQAGVEYAAPDYELKSFDYTEEAMFDQQWGLRNEGQTINNIQGTAGVDINVVPAWEKADGEGILVGILDTGVDITNTELSPNVYTNPNEIPDNHIDDDNNGYIDDVHGWNFADDNNEVFASSAEDTHGTQVAGIIAAAANDTGTMGVAPQVKILPIKFMKGGTGSTSDAIEAIGYAKTMGVQVLNCSWGGPDFNYALKEAITDSDILFICASGNDGNGGIAYPASFALPNVVSVGAIDHQGNITSFTSTGSRQDIYAPGKDIITTGYGNTYDTVSGTSFSAGFVTGIAALVKQAVPEITTDELRIVITQGTSEKGEGNLPVADADKAIKLALPINFIHDTDGRLSRAMRYANKIITPEIAELFTKFTVWSELDTTQKTAIQDFFTVTNTEMTDCESIDLDLIDSCIISLVAKQVTLDVENVLLLLDVYDNNQTFDSELQNLSDFIHRLELTSAEKDEVIALMQDGSEVLDIARAFITAKAIEEPLTDVLLLPSQTNDYDSITYTGEDQKNLRTLVERYHLNLEFITDYLDTNNLTPFELLEELYAWQEDHHFFIVDNTVSAYTASEPELNSFNQYKVTTGNYWSDGKISIDKTDGMASYAQSLLNLQGRNGLDLNLGLRYDPEVSDATIGANLTDLIPHQYMITEVDECYKWTLIQSNPDIYIHVRMSAFDITTYSYSYTSDASTLATYKALDGQQYYVGMDYYIRRITITSKTNGTLTASGLTNFYDTRYNLGVGIALDVPTIEKIGETIKYLHLPGGAKYKINSNNTLDGYLLNDLTFGTATGTDFTVNSVAAAYQLTDLASTKHFFDTNGKYLGTKDICGNKIQVYYANGLIDKIYDTALRYVKFTYTTVPNTSRTVTVTLYDNDATNPPSQLLYTIHETYNATAAGYLLTGITDAQSRQTQFVFTAYTSNVHFNACGSYLPPATPSDVANKTVYLESITSPTGAYTKYEYDTATTYYGPASSRDYKRVKERYDKTSSGATPKYNDETFLYTYSNMLWRYTTNNIYPLSSNTASNYSLINDLKEVTVLNNNLRMTTLQVYKNSTGVKQSQTEIVSVDMYNQPTEVKEKTYDPTDATKYTLSNSTLTWDSYGRNLDVLTESGSNLDPDYSIDNRSESDYGSGSPTIPQYETQYTYKDSYEYGQKSTRTFDATTKKILTDTTAIYNLTTSTKLEDTSKVEYFYDAYGNQTEVKITDYTPVPDVVKDIVYVFDSKYHIYPVSTTNKDVLDIDGNSLKQADGTTVEDITSTSTYDMFGRLLTSTDPNGFTTSYEYNNVGDCTEVTYPDNSTSQTIYDYTNRIVKSIQPDGTGSKTEYDVFGNVFKTSRLNKDDTGSYTVFDLLSENTYDYFMRLGTQKDYRSGTSVYNTTTYTYDFMNRITETLVKDQNNNTLRNQTSTYELGQQYSPSDDNKYNTVTTTTIASLTDNTKNYKSISYNDAAGKSVYTKVFDSAASGVYTTDTSQYIEYGVLERTFGDQSYLTRYSQQFTTNPGRNQSTNLGYIPDSQNEIIYSDITDGFGNQKQSVDARSNVTITKYDLMDRTIQVDTPFQKISGTTYYSKEQTIYDAAGRVVETRKTNNIAGAADAFNSKTKYTYDNMGRVVKTELVIDATHSQFSQNYYDSLGRLRRVYTGLNKALTINGLDNVSTNGDTSYSVTKYTYDFYGQMTGYTDALNHDETYTYYDLTGQLYTKTLRNGNTFTYTYNNNGELTQLVGAQSGKTTLTHTFTYDLAGMLLTAQDENGTTTYTNNGKGQCTKIAYSLGSNSYEQIYTYAGNKVSTYSFKVNTVTKIAKEYDYTNNDRVSYITYTGQTVESVELRYDYDGNGNVIQTLISNGSFNKLRQDYTYNLANLPVEIIDYTYAKRTLIYPPMDVSDYNAYSLTETMSYKVDGNLASNTNTLTYNGSPTNTDVTAYTYDNINRLVSEDYSENGTAKWTRDYNSFDDYNNILTLEYDDLVNSANDTTTTYTYDLGNKITNQLIKHGSNTLHDYDFNYDNAGNATTKVDGATTQMTYGYDALNRMATSTPNGGSTTTYKYNAAGQRISKSTYANISFDSIWDNGQIDMELLVAYGSNSYNQFLQGHSHHGMINYGTFAPGHVSSKGDLVTTVTTFNLTTNNMVKGDYEAYGNTLSDANSSDPYGYRGYYTDSETGLCYLNARYYDPSMQRFTQEDTYWNDNPQMNLYGYCSGNPVMYTDPSGNKIELSSTATKEKKQYERAISYLKTSRKGKELLGKLNNSTTVFTIVFVNDDMDAFDPSTKKIYWDVNSGLVMKNGTSIQSAALGLAHEMGHGAQYLDGDYDVLLNAKTQAEAVTARDKLEAANLKKWETPIAKQLGEPIRKKYHDASGVYTMNNSTHYRTTHSYPWYQFRKWGKHYTKDHNA